MTLQPVSVLVLADNPRVREIMKEIIDGDPRLTLSGAVDDLILARKLIARAPPDVVVLDADMRRGSPLDFLRWLRLNTPIPVLVISRETQGPCTATRQALAIGALGCLDLQAAKLDVRGREGACDALVRCAQGHHPSLGAASAGRPPVPSRQVRRAILIGSSTGGVDALERVLAPFPNDCPPTVIAQHMPASFLRNFQMRLNDHLAPRVRLAFEGEPLRPGTILLGGGGTQHVALRRNGPMRIQLPPVSGHEPYVPLIDTLFSSGLPHARQLVACLLTGMGRDGADAMLELRRAGARTVVQSSESCVVDGMPRAARENGAAEASVPLDELGRRLLQLAAVREEAAHD